MFKIKNFKIEIKHLVVAVSALGMLVGFLLSLCAKKKTVGGITFFASLLGLAAGVGMEAGVLPEPKCMKDVEIEILDDEENDSETVVMEDDEEK